MYCGYFPINYKTLYIDIYIGILFDLPGLRQKLLISLYIHIHDIDLKFVAYNVQSRTERDLRGKCLL